MRSRLKRLRQTILSFALGLALTLLLLSGISTWLLHTEHGAQQLAQGLHAASATRLHIQGVQGTLLGALFNTQAQSLRVEQIRWQTPDLQIDLSQIELQWSWSALLQGQLHIQQLHIGKLSLHWPNSDQPSSPPKSLQLPLAIHIEQLQIGQLQIQSLPLIEEIHARFDSTADSHQLSRLQLRHQHLHLTGKARINSQAPFNIQGDFQLQGQLEQHPLVLKLTAQGPLEKLRIELHSQQGLSGQAQLSLTPFAQQPLAELQVQLQDIDPRAWLAEAPQARLSLSAQLHPQANGPLSLHGPLRIHNRQSGPLDQNRLPIQELSGQLHWQTEHSQIQALTLKLHGQGQITGQVEWRPQQAQITAQAQAIDLRGLHSRLRSSQLSGPLSAELKPQQQHLELNLQGRMGRLSKLQIQAKIQHSQGQIHIQELRAHTHQGQALAKLQAHIGLAPPHALQLSGELQHLDPAAFSELPAGNINATLKVQGQLSPQPRLQTHYQIHDSQWATQPLSGQGRLHIFWPHKIDADLQLDISNNHLQAQGIWGQDNSRLNFKLQAQHLQALGLQGQLEAHGQLSGTLQHPQIQLQLDSPQLAQAERFKLQGLKLQLQAATQPQAPLSLDLNLQSLEFPQATETLQKLQNLQIKAQGRTAQHTGQAQARSVHGQQLSLAVQGGWQALTKTWQGQLTQLQLNSPNPAQNIQLNAPSRLELSQDHWQITALQLNNPQHHWQATLHAQATAQQLNSQFSLRGQRIGELKGRWQAGLHNAWQLNPQAAWAAEAKINLPDLSWLPELLTADWRTHGQLQGQLHLAGRPAAPELHAQLQGQDLGLYLPEQGLELEGGQLQAELHNQRLRIQTLEFNNRLRPAPLALQTALGPHHARLSQLTQQPGKLRLHGELQFDTALHNSLQNTHSDSAMLPSNNAWLELELDRLGVWQKPEQWILLSGKTRLDWQQQRLNAQGTLQADAGYWQLSAQNLPRLSEDVIVQNQNKQTIRPTRRLPLNLAIQANLGEHFYFHGLGLSSRLQGQIELRAQGKDLPRASGSIRSVDGQFSAYGQRLRIDHGILRFDGLLDNPGLDIRATRPGLEVEAGILISGNAQRPKIKLISEPERPDSEKLSWLILGHGPENMGTADTSTLVNAASDLLGNDAGKLLQQLRKHFGLDEFGLHQGRIDDGNRSRLANSRIASLSSDQESNPDQQIFRIGKRLGGKLRLSYEQALGKTESIIKLTLELSQRLSLTGRAGSDNAIDLFYTFKLGQTNKPAQATPSR